MNNRIFKYDSSTGEFAIMLNELKLIREFNELWLLAKQRCKCFDENGEIGRGNSDAIMKYANYCKFVYLYADWSSPYADFVEQERIVQSSYDSYMDPDKEEMEALMTACNKWDEIQNSDRNIRILRAAQNQVDSLIDYFMKDNKLSLMKDGKPVYQAKSIMAELKEVGSISDELDRCEERVRVGEKSGKNIRGNAMEGLIIDFAKEKERRSKLSNDSKSDEETFLNDMDNNSDSLKKPVKSTKKAKSKASNIEVIDENMKKPSNSPSVIRGKRVRTNEDDWTKLLNELK